MRFNQPLTIADRLSSHPDATVNHEGGLAFTMDACSRLHARLVASLFDEKTFYTDARTGNAELIADVAAAAEVNPEFPLILAAFARNEMHMRKTPIAVLVLAAEIPACRPFVRKWTPHIVARADEITEVLAFWHVRHGHIGNGGFGTKTPSIQQEVPHG